MSSSTRTGGATPIVISMDPATTIVTTVDAVRGTPTAAQTTPDITTQPSEVVETTPTERAEPITSEEAVLAPVPSSMFAEPSTTAIADNGDEEQVYTSLTTPGSEIPSSRLQTTLVSSPSSTSPSSFPSQPKPGLSVPASIGLGVSMGVIAFLVIGGVGYAVFGRYLRNMRRNSARGVGVMNGNKWWKGRRRDSWNF